MVHPWCRLSCRYRIQLYGSMSLVYSKEAGVAYSLPFVASVTQKGSGFAYEIPPNQPPTFNKYARNTGALSEFHFTIYAKRNKLVRFTVVIIMVLMWALSLIMVARALYAALWCWRAVDIQDATLATATLFALPQLRTALPSIPTQVSLTIDAACYIWCMVLVSVACMMYLWVLYMKTVQKRRDYEKAKGEEGGKPSSGAGFSVDLECQQQQQQDLGKPDVQTTPVDAGAAASSGGSGGGPPAPPAPSSPPPQQQPPPYHLQQSHQAHQVLTDDNTNPSSYGDDQIVEKSGQGETLR
jgi:hypothetical protein